MQKTLGKAEYRVETILKVRVIKVKLQASETEILLTHVGTYANGVRLLCDPFVKQLSCAF